MGWVKTPPGAGWEWPAIERGGEFHNIGSVRNVRLADVLKWKMGLGPPDDLSFSDAACASEAPVCTPDWRAISEPPSDAITITWIGHSSFLIQLRGCNLITDPVFSEYCSPVRSPRFRRLSRPGMQPSELPPLDAILISHNHYDHMDRESVCAITPKAPVICPMGLRRYMRGWGVRDCLETTWGDSCTNGIVRITCLPAQHGSARTAFDRNRSLWCGWLIETVEEPVQKVVFVGDSGYGPIFAEMGARFGPIDVALIPIGAYRPFWFMHPVHMNPKEAVRVHRDLRARRSIAMHWGAFHLADEPTSEPVVWLRQAREEAGIAPEDFSVSAIGETVPIGGRTNRPAECRTS